jgi:hypothetical protein
MAEPEVPAVDVVRIMREIRESIQKKRARGVYTPEELESLAEVRFRSYAEAAEVDPRLLERLLGPSHDWNIAPDYLVRSHREGAGARLIVLAKKLARPIVRLYTDHLVLRQAQVNQYFLHLLHDSIRESVRLQAEVQALRRRLEELEAQRGGPPKE